ncbi:MAG: lytic transglycosylase domain-containing protein, partial [Nitrospinaceae bacterium]
MEHIKKHITLILVFLTLPLLYSFSSHSFYLSGLTSFSTASPELDNKGFLIPEPKLKIEAQTEEQRVKNKIRKVISKYRAGLGMKSLKQVPHRIYQESKKYDYDPLFLTALIVTESSFNNWAKSRKGALGLMQIKPRTGHALASEMGTAWAGPSTLFDPATNIALGAFYLNKLKKRFKDMNIALEAYNHGPSRIARYLRKGKLPEDYSKKVFRIYDLIQSQSI